MSILKNFNNIFLDRDGIINEVIMRDSVVSSPRSIDEFKFRSEIKEFVTALQKQNKKIFVVSNQPDIARKKLTEENLELMTDLIRNELKINQISYCKHDNSDNCKCRKPLPGMLNHYLEIYNLSKSHFRINDEIIFFNQVFNQSNQRIRNHFLINFFLIKLFSTCSKIKCPKKI